MKIALYKNIAYDFVSVWEEGRSPSSGYVQVSEFIDAEFPSLKNEDIVLAQVEALNKMETAIHVEYQHKIKVIKDRKQELMALTVQS